MGSFISHVKIQNYRSIGRCSIALGTFTLLVGPNGAGKSNFLDALRFIADSLRYTLEHALRDRSGIQEVRRRSQGHPHSFGISVNFNLGEGRLGFFGFRLGPMANGGFEVLKEECRLGMHSYVVQKGRLQNASLELRDSIEPDRLYLTYASAFPEFRPAFDALSRMVFLNLNPESIRSLQDPDPGDVLLRDGRNTASVVRRLKSHDIPAFDRIGEYIKAIVPSVEGVEPKALGPKETLEFRQKVAGSPNPWRFLAASMSDGTLRALGVLVGLFHAHGNGKQGVRFIGIEEPEIALHPAAASRLMDALIESSRRGQVLVTTHSPDLLDHSEIKADNVRAVDAIEGETVISVVDETGRSAVRDRLYTVGELLRLGQVVPDRGAFLQETSQLRLFSGGDEP